MELTKPFSPRPSKSLHHFNFLLGCSIGVLGEERRAERVGVGGGRQGGRRRARDCHRGRASGERERARGRWGAEALSALRYVGTLLNPERLGENAARGSKGLTPPPVLVQVKGVLLLHKTGQIRPQSVSRRTTMGSSICGPHLLSPGSPPLLDWRGPGDGGEDAGRGEGRGRCSAPASGARFKEGPHFLWGGQRSRSPARSQIDLSG